MGESRPACGGSVRQPRGGRRYRSRASIGRRRGKCAFRLRLARPAHRRSSRSVGRHPPNPEPCQTGACEPRAASSVKTSKELGHRSSHVSPSTMFWLFSSFNSPRFVMCLAFKPSNSSGVSGVASEGTCGLSVVSRNPSASHGPVRSPTPQSSLPGCSDLRSALPAPCGRAYAGRRA